MKGLVVLACLILGAFGSARAADEAREAPEAPDWELTAAEQAQARNLAEASPAIQEHAAAGKLFYVAAELFRDKQSTDRQAEVTHYRYEGDLTLVTQVNLSRRDVVDVRTHVHYPTRLSREEFELAKTIVLADPDVRKELGSDAAAVVLEPMAMRTFTPGDPLLHHRVFRMLFKLDGDYLRSPIVSVDLTTRQVIFDGLRKPPQPGARDAAPGRRPAAGEVDHE